jgi:transposase-like protein
VIILCVRWYLRYPLSYRDLEEMMAERGLSVDHSTIARWVLFYALILNRCMRREMRRPNRSWRVDETYLRVAGKWTYLYRAIDSAGDTIDFMLSPNRDLTAAKGFLRLALSAGPVRPRVINVGGHPAYASAIEELKQQRELGRKCRCRPSPYLNNIIEQDGSVANSGRTGPRARLFFARLRSDSENAVDELALRDGIVPGNPTDLTFADCVHRFVALDRSASALHRSELEAGRNPLLNEAMVLLNDVVQIRCGSVATSASEFTGVLQFGDCAGVRWMPIHVDHPRARSRAG